MVERYATYNKQRDFFIAMSDTEGNSFDNKEALGERFVLVMITKGSGIAYMDGYSIPYIAPCLFCVNEKEHFVIPESDELALRAVFFVPNIINSVLNFENVRNLPFGTPFTVVEDRDLIQSFLVRKEEYHGKYSLGPVSEKKMLKLLDQIHKILTEQLVNWPCRSRSYLFEILFFIDNLFDTDHFTYETCLEMADVDFQEILVYVYNNYEKRITVTEITDRFHISKTTLAKMFRTNLNETLLSYLNKLRISMASTMLRDTLLPISEIMTRVGFSDSAHFLRTFKRYTGFTPTSYREKYGWM